MDSRASSWTIVDRNTVLRVHHCGIITRGSVESMLANIKHDRATADGRVRFVPQSKRHTSKSLYSFVAEMRVTASSLEWWIRNVETVDSSSFLVRPSSGDLHWCQHPRDLATCRRPDGTHRVHRRETTIGLLFARQDVFHVDCFRSR